MINIENTEEQKNTGAQEFGNEIDQASLLKNLAEMGADGFALQQRAEQLIQNPEAFLELLGDFETMKAETLAAISELFGKVDASGREKLLAAKELLKFAKLMIEALSADLLEAGRDIAEGGKDILGGILSTLLTGKGRKKFVLVATLILASCTTFPSAVQTYVAPDVAYASGLGTGTPTATLNAPITREPKLPTATQRPTNTPRPTATETATEVAFSLPEWVVKAFEYLGYRFQFDGKEQKDIIHCLFKTDSIRKTDFWVGDIQVLRVGTCYLLDKDQQTQEVTLPMVFYNKKLDRWFTWGTSIDAGKPTDGFIDAQLDAITKVRSNNKGFFAAQFNIGNFKGQTADYLAFFESASASMQSPDDEFFLNGDTADLPDKSKAQNLVFPSTASFMQLLEVPADFKPANTPTTAAPSPTP